MEEKVLHTHDVKFVYWHVQGPPHRHMYSTRTSFNDRHTHLMSGVTSFDDGHVHYYRGAIGRAIPLPDGGHIHEFAGKTSITNRHTHSYYERTGKDY
ncbi:YmaF family protein [Aneurinibacillus sp. Ricciae_BoGa-3]|uniref:YmaF family protein n=1 Tax=Aneurinibacillus sp. Ricciae_BoGa-3 TaxID=3022697 RepID=UPI00233FFF85|nr:YmaF family protein [Aneurinibacillus sp. Ricciae_BoGa-3]WCK52992.1 YmaF family protein [Aneurinibacillus sp. Ricciae_BoGa-3]